MKSTKVFIGLLCVILLLGIALAITIKNNSSIEKEWKDAVENVKTYSEQYSSSENKNRALKLTVDQLNSSNDSIIQKLNNVRKELKVKDSKLQSLQYVSSSFAKTDTIILKDTLFKDPQMAVDTLVSDEWYSVRVGLKYPSTVAVSPMFKSEKSIIVSTKRETVKPAKKFFLFRWFQKKHTILNIDVVEKNPYVQNQDNRYIKIIE
jgi:hypothetical protein